MTKPANWLSLPRVKKARLAAQRAAGGSGKLKPGVRARKPIRPVSTKRAKENRRYIARVKAWKLENPVCKVCSDFNAVVPNPTQDCHHIRGRLGSLLMDEHFWLPVCGRHHLFIGDNPHTARALGFLAEKGDWNRCERHGTNDKLSV